MAIDTSKWSIADQTLLSDADKVKMAAYKEAYANGDKSANALAESLRAKYGYSGGSNGSLYNKISSDYGYNNSKNVSTIDTTPLIDWKNNYIKQQTAELEKAYNDAIAERDNAYNKNVSEYLASIDDARNAYKSNINTLYEDTYKNNVLAQQQAASRGLTSSAQGVALGTSGLMSATRQASNLANDRDVAINKINLALNNLSSENDIAKATLKSNLDLDKISKMSDAEVKYIAQLMSALEYNSTEQNKYNLSKDDAEAKYLLAMMQNEWQSGENQKDRDLQKELAKLSARSYGGYGGGYYRNGYSNGSSGTRSSGNSTENSKIAWFEKVANSGQYTESQILKAQQMLEKGYSTSDVGKYLLGNKSTTKKANTTNVSTEKFKNAYNENQLKKIAENKLLTQYPSAGWY